MYEAWLEFPEREGGLRKNTFRGQGMDNFWNHTLWIIIKICCFHVYFVFPCRKAIFDAPPEDPNYQPLPEEDRPGGFNWGEGQRVGAEHEHDDWKKKNNTKIENVIPHTSLNQIIIMCSVR